MNKVILVGNLGQDPELRHTSNQTAVCNFSVATSEYAGDGETRTEWHNIVVWSKHAENCAQYLSKGKKVAVEGRLQTRSWEGDDGVKRYKTEVVANNVEFITPKTEGQVVNTGHQPAAATASTNHASGSLPVDDIPF